MNTALRPRVKGRRIAHNALTSLRFMTLVVGTIVMITPFAYMVSTSLKPQAFVLETPPQFIPHPATLDNYIQAWTKQDFSHFALNSAFVAITSTILAVWLSSMMAYAFARFDFQGKKWLFRILLLGLMIPGMMLIIPQFILTKQIGLLDNLWGLVIFYVAGNLSMNTFLLRSFFEGIPGELDQAMQVDGASVWRRYWNLAIPLSRPALATTTIFTFLATWDEFAWAMTVIQSPENRTLPIAIQTFHGQNNTQWGLVFAASLIAIIPVIIVYLVFQRHFVQGLTAGAVKG